MGAEWKETFKFIDTLPEGSVITAWWDYGHWLAYWNGDNVYVSLDNIQDRPDIIYTVASSFTHTTDINCRVDVQNPTCPTSQEDLDRAEIEALSLLKPLQTTHILIDKEIIGGTWGGKFAALEKIASNNVGCMQMVGCRDQEDGVFCMFGTGPDGTPVGVQLTNEQWTAIEDSDWPGFPLFLGTSQEGNEMWTNAFGRTDSWGKQMYMSAFACGNYFYQGAAANSPVMYAFAQRMFFRDQGLKQVKLVYEDGWNVIYEVDWTDIPDPVSSVLPPLDV